MLIDQSRRLLRSHVRRAAEFHTGERPRGVVLSCGFWCVGEWGWFWFVGALGESPVEQDHFAKLADHNVRRFDVPMDHTLLVRERDSVADREEGLDEAAEPQIAVARAGSFVGIMFGDRIVQRAMTDETHRIERDLIVGA